MYDIIFIGDNCAQWTSLKTQYPTAKRASEFFKAQKMSMTKMFWAIWPDVTVNKEFDFSYKVPRWEENYTHVFKNGTDYKHGICLLNKHTLVSKNEIEHRFFTNKKEVNIQASTPRPYDVFDINTYDEYLAAIKTSTTKMFWAIWPDVMVNKDFDFSYKVPKWEEKYTHVFKNGDNYKDGICLLNTHIAVSKNEIEHRFFTNKKEVNIQASSYRPYDIFYIDSYDEYLAAIKTSTTKMFWVVWPDVEVVDDFNFGYRVQKWEEKYTHVFLNGSDYKDGICLTNKHIAVSKNEIEHRFFTNKKEVNIQASSYRPYDVVFISYNEVDAEKNYNLLLLTVPRAKRVDGVSGIHQAHIAAAKQCSTSMFWVVDGDAEIVDNFSFDYLAPKWEQDCVHVWRSRNPVNGLAYGYGGVKLLPRLLTEQVDVTATDMTTSISHNFKAMSDISNITSFNTDAFATWRSAFRECAKLASNTIRGQIDEETKQRLDVWCTSGRGAMFGDYALRGAAAGRKYGTVYQFNNELGKINDYDWLYQQFLEENKLNV